MIFGRRCEVDEWQHCIIQAAGELFVKISQEKKKEGWGSWGWEGVESMRRGSYWKKCVCGRKSVCFVVTVEPASMWPLPQWRQSRGNRADGWLAGVSASLLSTTVHLSALVGGGGGPWGRCRGSSAMCCYNYCLSQSPDRFSYQIAG